MFSTARHAAARFLAPAIQQTVAASSSSLGQTAARCSMLRLSLQSANTGSTSSMRSLSDFKPSTPATRTGVQSAPIDDITSSAHTKDGKGASSDVTRQAARVADAVRLAAAKFTHDKPAVEVPFTLRNGTQGIARRVALKDIEALHKFHSEAPMLGHGMGTEENFVDGMTHVLFAASAPHSDALVAVVGDQIIGLTLYDSAAEVYEPQLDQDAVSAMGMPTPAAVGKGVKVHQDYVGQGVWNALQAARLKSAKDAGYGSMAAYSSHPAIKTSAAKLGGVSEPGSAGWTVVPCELYMSTRR